MPKCTLQCKNTSTLVFLKVSILGPLLFLIYVNDFPQCITKGKTITFADDTNLFFTEKCYNSVFKKANQELKLVDNWLLSNKLSVNINKTSSIVFHTPNTPLPVSNNLYLRGKALNRVESLRFLGITVHEHLSWKPHMELLLQKIRINTAVVRRIQHYLNQEILLLLYNSMVKSHLQYCILTWCNGNKTLLQTLQRAANKFIRPVDSFLN